GRHAAEHGCGGLLLLRPRGARPVLLRRRDAGGAGSRPGAQQPFAAVLPRRIGTRPRPARDAAAVARLSAWRRDAGGELSACRGDNALRSGENGGMTSEIPLGRDVAYPRAYDPGLLFPIPRDAGRGPLGISAEALPFTGHDRWHAYELSWLDPRGKPVAETATFVVPADSPCLIESKSLKLYLNSLNASRFATRDEVRARIAAEPSATAVAA